jgi:eukaryotic-like serine/threonine-protein kinase
MKEILESDHPNLLNCMSNLAIDYLDVGRTEGAIALQEEAFKLKKENPGPEHPDTLRTRDSLALAYRSAGKYAQAMALQEETLELAKRKMGPEHHHTLLFMSNLAEMYADAKRFSEAIPLQVEAFNEARSKLGADNFDTLTYMNRLIRAYLDTERFTDAETIARECLKLREAKKPDDWSRFYTMNQLGGALSGQKKYGEAEPLLIGGYDGMKDRERKIPAPLKKELAAALSRIGVFYEARGNPEKAAQWRAKIDSPVAEGGEKP